jgi:hypothetical protein
MKKIIYLALMVVSLTTLFSGCKKEGPAGKDGNANVVSSSTTVSNWVYEGSSWKSIIPYPAITQDIINSGAVLVYMKTGESYNQLPLTFYQNPAYSTTIEVSTVVGGLALYWSDSDLSQPINPGTRTFKVVVIASSGMIQNPDVDYSNYEEVKSAFNLVD